MLFALKYDKILKLSLLADFRPASLGSFARCGRPNERNGGVVGDGETQNVVNICHLLLHVLVVCTHAATAGEAVSVCLAACLPNKLPPLFLQ